MTTKLFCFMKNAICSILILVHLCLSAQNNADCILSQKIKCAYQDDIKALAAELMAASESKDTNSISIIPAYENDLWKALGVIINKSDSTLKKVVFDQACIHKFIVKSISFRLDTTVLWAQNWIDDPENITNETVKQLLQSFDYSVSFFERIPTSGTLKFDEILNFTALINQLKQINGFESVSLSSFDGDVNYLTAVKNNNLITLTFSFGWGDCPAGCINRRNYEFVVDIENCSLNSERAYGDNLFGNISFNNCNITNNINDNPLEVLYKPMEFEKNPIANFSKNANVEANGYEFKSVESNLPPLEPIHPKLTPGYSYFWNFGDGSFDITTEPNGDTDRIYNETGVYNVSVERTKIKSDPRFSAEIERKTDGVAVNSIATPPTAFLTKTRITNGKNIELINVRGAVPGVPFTVVSSFKNPNKQLVGNSIVLLDYDPSQLLHSNFEVYYCDNIVDVRDMENGRKELEIQVNDINAYEQRNFFSSFQVDPEIEIGTEIVVCLSYENLNRKYEICDTFSVGKSHDPSYKKFIDPNCFINDTLEFLIHLENDGNARTEFVEVKDSLVPSLKIDAIDWKKETNCHQTKGTDELSESEEQVIFTFNPMRLKGTNQPGYLKTFGYEEIKDEFTFKMKLDNPLLSLTGETYLCNEADVYFDDNPAYPISDCFVCFFNNMDGLPKKRHCQTINVAPNVQEKKYPKLLRYNPVTVNKGDSITIEADLSELPAEADTNLIWWPGQETSRAITVKPLEDTLFRLFAYWEENNTIFYTEDEVVVRVNFCDIDENDFDINVDSLICYHNDDAKIEIKMKVDGDYSIFWDDVNDAIYGDQVFNRGMLSAGIYNYTIVNNDICCKLKGSITIEEKTSLRVLIEKQKLEDDTYLLKAYYFGGQPPYNFHWSGNGQTFDDNVDEIGPVANINYVFQIIDANNCEVIKPAKPLTGDFNCEEE